MGEWKVMGGVAAPLSALTTTQYESNGSIIF